jgi:hypothetical protein
MDWLDNETAAHEFTVLVLCNGNWEEFYDLYLGTLDEIVPAIRLRGGDIFCVARKGPKEEVVGNSKLRIFRDEEQEIPTMYELLNPKAQSPLPAVVILGKDKKVLFKWDPIKEGNVTILPRNLLHIAKFVN